MVLLVVIISLPTQLLSDVFSSMHHTGVWFSFTTLAMLQTLPHAKLYHTSNCRNVVSHCNRRIDFSPIWCGSASCHKFITKSLAKIFQHASHTRAWLSFTTLHHAANFITLKLPAICRRRSYLLFESGKVSCIHLTCKAVKFYSCWKSVFQCMSNCQLFQPLHLSS